MSRLLPFKSEATTTPDGPKVLSLEDEDTEDALSALSSETAREILSLVYEEPRTPPEIRDEVDTSLQNVHYHLEHLEDADLIQPAGSGYSEKGTEMTVYAPASEAVVLFAGREGHRSRLKTALVRLLGAVGLLAVASYAVRRFAETTGVVGPDLSGGGPRDQSAGGADGGDGGDAGGPGGGPEETGSGGAQPETEAPFEPDGTQPTTEAGGDVGVMDVGTDAPTSVATGTPEPARTPTEIASQTPAATPSATPAQTPTPAGTPSPTQTPTPAGTPSPTQTPAPTLTETATATPTPAPTPTETATATPTPTPTETATATPTPAEMTPEPTVTDRVVDAAAGAAANPLADPAVTFFLGGMFMLGVASVWWYWTE
ncbi:MAG: ArsR/SmtB family transcription factor [Haloarculaceae archaeon]